MKSLRRSTVLALTLSLLPAGSSILADTLAGAWPQYRGPARDGRSTETGLLDTWPDGGPREIWRVPIGPAFSGVSVVGERLYTMASDTSQELALSFDVRTGKEVWRTAVGPQFEESFGNGPRSTPTVDGDRLYVLTSHGVVVALSTATGEEAWRVDFGSEFGVQVPRRGFSESPLVTGDLVVVSPGAGNGKSVAAFDKRTGLLRWTVGSDPAGYSSPVAIDFRDQRQLVLLSPSHAMGLSTSGDLLWRHEFAPGISVKPAMPLLVGSDLLFFSASYDIGGLALRLQQSGDQVRVQELWQDRVMRNHFNTSVAVDGYLYGFDNATLRCVEAETGRSVWAKRGGMGKGSLIYAEGHLIVLTETGRLLLVEASAEGFTEKGRGQVLEGRSWTLPSLADGRLYVRNLEEMVCLDLSD